MKKTVLLSALIFVVIGVYAQRISQYNQRLIDNWQFVRQDLGGIWEAVRTVKPGNPEAVPLWKEISLPHCFNETDAVDPDVNYYQGPGWYRSVIEINNPYKNGRTLLHFEGAGQKTTVFVGLKKAGSHEGGYDEWFLDISDLIDSTLNNKLLQKTYGSKIPISVRCDNSRDLEMIPSDLSDFNLYGGLYRYVNLIYVPSAYLKNVKITPEITDRKAKNGRVQLQGKFYNPNEKAVKLHVRVTDQHKTLISETSFNSKAYDSFDYGFDLSSIKLWSPDSPILYNISVVAEIDGEKQTYSDHFGFREFQFEKNGPFLLNGERLLLHGTHRHEDFSRVGAAMTEDMIRREIQMIKDMGANFIRLGHYQQSRIVLNLCDSLGILVWEEIPWCRGGLGGDLYKSQARRMLTNMIAQHYNHPAIIIWGLGNENDWPGDFPEFNKNKIRSFMSELNDLSHQLDKNRKTAIRRCNFCKDIVDVYSPSIWAGWYRGKYTEYRKVSEEEMRQVDHFLHVEWGASCHAGRHSEDPDIGLDNIMTGGGADERSGDASMTGGQPRVSKDGDWTETYACNLFDWTLKEQEKMPWLTGSAFWTFKDFSTPVRPENPVPYMNQKGVVCRDLTPKENYYVVQSYWSKTPMIHIYGHTWPTRWGSEGQVRLVKVYSNCPEVELFLNGESMGAKRRSSQDFPAAGLHWDVKFNEGQNKLVAVSWIDHKKIQDSIQVNYQTRKWGMPAYFKLREKEINEEYSWLEVKTFDTNHILCLDANNRVGFSVCGDIQLEDNLGTPWGSRKVELSNGCARIKIRKTGTNYSVFVKAEGIPTVSLISKGTPNP